MNNGTILAIIGAIVVLVLLGCLIVGAIIFLILPSQPEGGPSVPPGQQPPGQNVSGNGTNATGGMSQEDLETWQSISKENVEDICLRTAKQEAGTSSSMVYGCDCDEIVRADQKSYDCSISTADPFTEYFAKIDCFLVGRYCDIETNYGKGRYTFQQLRDLQ